jgi:hypothetical protein
MDLKYRYTDATLNLIQDALDKLREASGRDDVLQAIERKELCSGTLGELVDEVEGLLEFMKDANEGDCTPDREREVKR